MEELSDVRRVATGWEGNTKTPDTGSGDIILVVLNTRSTFKLPWPGGQLLNLLSFMELL